MNMNYLVLLILVVTCLFANCFAANDNKCKYSNIQLVKFVKDYNNRKIIDILKNGCDLKSVNNRYDLDFFNTAVSHDDIEMVKLLLSQGFKVNKVNHYGNLSISWCISIEMAKYLVENGIDINFKGKDGLTPLHDLIISGRLEIAKYILKKGAKINAQDNFGFTPLLFAVTSDPVSFIHYLINNGANVNNRTNDRTTALHLAVLRGEFDMVKTIIDAGADVNAQNIGKMTPLHQAAIDGRYEIVKLLVESGADVNMRNIRGKTPLWAVENMRPYPTRVKPEEMNRNAVIEYLKEVGGI